MCPKGTHREARIRLLNGEKNTENRLMDMGRGEEGARCMEAVTRKLTSPYVKQTAKGNVLCVSGNSNRGLYQPGGLGWGAGSRGRGPMADSC